jgi:hypothetical protein
MKLLDMLANSMGNSPSSNTAGLAQQAVNINHLYPMWKKQYIDAVSQGVDFPEFEQWAATQGLTTNALLSPQ